MLARKRTPLPRPKPLPGTERLDWEGDLASRMVAGIDRFLMSRTEATVAARARRGRPTERGRRRLRQIIGVVDPREPAGMQLVGPVHGRTAPQAGLVAQGKGYRVFTVRWPVLKGVDGEGLLLVPTGTPVADVVALPDCDSTPEMLVGLNRGVPKGAQFARRLAENGCRVLVPVLVDRSDTHSGIPEVRMTNQPHREFVYRAAFELGRHIIGYEVQKVLAAVDWFEQQRTRRHRPIGVFGYGEGGLIALYAGAADTRIDVVGVSGYFQPRERVWSEPIYRNVFALTKQFGDAELASLVAPRALVVEASRHPDVAGPPAPSPGRIGAAPGVIATPALDAVRAEFERAGALVARLKPLPRFVLVTSRNGTGPPGTGAALGVFLDSLGRRRRATRPGVPPKRVGPLPNADARMKRQFDQLVEHTQHLMREAEFRRAELWAEADDKNIKTWQRSSRPYREHLWDEVIGRLPSPTLAPRARTRLVYNEPTYKGYEVVLDVYPDVFAYGILLVPKRMKRGERRPVVVCQHGLEGRAQDVADPRVDSPAYHRFACQLAERGFVTYAPQNPYIGMDDFRVLQRKANPLGLSLFSIIVPQHEQTLAWLASLEFVDPNRLAFYGLSYGGKTAMRVPALVERYCLSICSGDFNEWIWKNSSARHSYSYLTTGEYEMFEFNLGNTYNYAEMSWLVCPRPFMVERGHDDGVAPDEWVAYEYAKTRRRYDRLGIGGRTQMEVFNGPHTIHGKGTFRFLHQHLNHPEP